MDSILRNAAEQDAFEFNRYDPYWSDLTHSRRSNFQEHYSRSTANNHLIEALKRWVREPNQRLLDVGCGKGRNALALASLGYSVVGIDLSPSAVEFARAAALAKGLTKSATFSVASIFGFPKPGMSFRGIYDDGCLQHIVPGLWEQYAQSVKAMAGTPGHFFLLGFSSETVAWKTYQRDLSKDNGVLEKDGHYTRLFSSYDIENLSAMLGPLRSQFRFRQTDHVVWGLWVFELAQV